MRFLVVAFAGALVTAQTFRSSTEVVLITASVTRDGRPVAGLAPADFRVADNGVVQNVSLLQVDRMPIDVTIVIGSGVNGFVDPALSSANRFRAKLNSLDRLRLISASESIAELEPMASVSTAPAYQQSFTHGNSFNDALFYAMSWPTDPARRHLIISYPVSIDTWSAIETSMLVKLARRTDAVINILTSPPRMIVVGNRDNGLERERAELERVARQTGGTSVPVSQAAKTFDQILEEFRASYVLQFVPPAGPSPGWHALEVTVPSIRGVTVRARQGYER